MLAIVCRDPPLVVADRSDISPPERVPAPASGAGSLRRPRRVLVWSLIVLASVLLIVSMTANWVQLAALDTDRVQDTTDEILADEDVQQALSIYLVDQLYANVDVRAAIEQQLPGSFRALSAPVAAATRQLALNVSERALATPRVQALVSDAVGRAHERFVNLIRSKGEYVATTGGEVTLDYGSLVADLAVRLGVDPATVSEIRRVVQELSGDLRQSLTTAQARIESVRAELAQVQGGSLSSQLEQDLGALQQTVAQLQTRIASLETTIESAEGKAPSQLQGRLAALDTRLSDLDGRLTALEDQTAAVLKSPSEANVERLDPALASTQSRITTLLGRQVVQSPGQLVVIGSDQLDGVQTAVRALRNLGFVLPLLVLLLYVGAIYLARGWRRRALIAAGGGILVATLLVLLVRRLAGGAVVDSVAGSETVEPAVQSVWAIVTEGLRARSLFILVIGLAFVAAGLLAGPGRHAVAVRRFLAPYLRDQPVVVYAVVAVLFLLWLALIPGLNNLGQVLVIAGLLALAVVGIEALRRQTAQEFPPGPNGP
jgi:cell division septum initiation protein DivIVA